MNIQRSVPSEITELEAAYKKAFESNVFPEYMIEDACDDEPDLSPAISISRDDLITLTIYEDGRIIGGAILDCTGNDKKNLNGYLYHRNIRTADSEHQLGKKSNRTIPITMDGLFGHPLV